ncbi:hypothetical protein N7534_004784 [Penicillium rubens]|nr:hypothetical protein N7534_004784 [Penicillium rubens]KAJ6157041.1 hypothetical protein N7497_005926 [Penicillium chrysogenum]
MICSAKRKVLDGLNRRYIYGRVPLLHTIIFLVEMAVAARLAAKFNTYYAERPVLTTMVTNAVLGGVADTVAQLITAFRTRRPPTSGDDFLSIEIPDLDKQKPPRSFPLTKKNPTAPAFKRVAFDQFIFAPFGLACFFTYMTIAEGGGRRALTHKFRDVYLPTLKANFVLWPAVQILNFRVIPIQFQIPFVSTVGIAWTAYLSLTNSAEEV